MIQRAKGVILMWLLIANPLLVRTFHGLQGHTYVYKWSATLEAGVPELSDESSVRQLSASVQITVLLRDSKRLLFEVKNFSASSIKTAEHPWASPIILPFLRKQETFIAEDPDFSFLVSLQDRELQLSFPSTPEGFSGERKANLCRGIASLFIFQRPVEGLGVAEFTVQEDSVTGTCATTYLVRPLNDRTLMERLNLSVCGRGALSEVVRTKNFDKCAVPLYYNTITPAGFRCDPGASSCEGNFLRSSSTRYAVCSGDSYAYPLLITNYNPFIVSPWGARTEQVIAISKQNAVVTEVKNATGEKLSWKSIENTGESIFFSFKELPDIRPRENLEKFMDVMSDETGIIDSVEELTKGLIYYGKEDFDRIMRPARINVNSVSRKMFFYALVSAGTESTISYLAELLDNEELTTDEATYFISNLVMTVKKPYSRLLRRLVALIESPVVRRSSSLRKTAMTSISSLVRMSCVSPSHAATRFPVTYHGPFCNSSDPIIGTLANLLGKTLKRGPTDTDRIAALSSLTTLGHEAVIPVIVNFLSSKEAKDVELRTRAILAFHRLAHAELPEVTEILYNTLTNYKENDQVRMGAFTLFILSNPPVHRWFQLAVMTWYEPNLGVASFIYTSFSAMSMLESPLPLLIDLREKSTSAMRLAKPVIDGRNVNQIWSHYMYPEKLGAYVRSELFSTKGEPTNLYTRLNLNSGPFDFDVAEIETSFPYIVSAKDLWSNFFGGKKGSKEIYIHATFMESIERAYSTTFEELGHLLHGVEIGNWVTFQPLVRVHIEFPSDLGILTSYVVNANLGASSRKMSLNTKKFEEKIKGSFEGAIRLEGRATATIGFLFPQRKMAIQSFVKGFLDLDASGEISTNLQEFATLKFGKFQGGIQFTQTMLRVDGEKIYPLDSPPPLQVEELVLPFPALHAQIGSSGYRLPDFLQKLKGHKTLSTLDFSFLMPPTLRGKTFFVSSQLKKAFELSLIRDAQKNSARVEIISDLKEAGGFDQQEEEEYNKVLFYL